MEFKDLNAYIQKIIRSAASQSDFPEAGAAVLFKERRFEADADAYTIKIHKLVKIFNARGIKEYGEIRVAYDDTYEYVGVDFARIIKPDHSVVTLSPMFFTTSTPYSNFPLYSNCKYRVISIPGLEENTVIEYQVTKRRIKLVNGEDFWDIHKFKEPEPVLYQTYTVNFPREKKIHVRTLGMKKKPIRTIEGKTKTLTWKFTEQPPLMYEDVMPPIDEVTPQIWISSFDDWDEFGNWWRSLFQDQMDIDNEMKSKVKELTSKITDAEEKIRAIYQWITLHVRYIIMEYGDAGFRPHKASEVFRNRYGDCKDQAILLITMLREAGMEAYPVLLNVKRKNVIKEIPMMQFNHCITVAKIDGKYIFLDPTKETCPYGYNPALNQDKTCIAFTDNRYEFLKLPLENAAKNKETIKINITMENNGSINVQRTTTMCGEKALNLREWFKCNTPDRIRETIERETSTSCPGAEMIDYSIHNLDILSQPFVFETFYQVHNWLKQVGGNNRSFKLPMVEILIAGTTKKKRKHSIYYETTEWKEYEVNVRLPNKMKPMFIPEAFSLRNRYGSFSYKVKTEPSKLFIKISYIRNVTRIPPKGYSKWKKSSDAIANKLQEEIVLAV